MIPERFAVTKQEVDSALWSRLSAHLEQRIASLRAQNDGPLDELPTAALRGRIAELKALLACAPERPK